MPDEKAKKVPVVKRAGIPESETDVAVEAHAREAAADAAMDAQGMIDELVQQAQKALLAFMDMDQEQVDNIVHAMALAGLDQHVRLAKLAYEETGRGVVEDKIIKNIFATEYIWHSIKGQKTVGIIEENELEDYVEVAEPVGSRRRRHPGDKSHLHHPVQIADLYEDAQSHHLWLPSQRAEVLRRGGPGDARRRRSRPGPRRTASSGSTAPSIAATNALMNHPGVSLVLATGGSGMVRAAYSTGKPALGVGPGNVPCYIEKTARLERACTDLMLSKTFDNGMICASEQAVIVDEEIADEFERIMKAEQLLFPARGGNRKGLPFCHKPTDTGGQSGCCRQARLLDCGTERNSRSRIRPRS